jgi:dipeptidyl aminopeptidase/acylaminoacyl peptidase
MVGIRIVIFCLAFGFLPAKTPITHEAMWLMKRVGAPQPSPDGKWAVFAVTEPAYDEKDQASDLWVVPSDGKSKPRRLTASKGGESGVAWSPDSTRIAFSAKREGDEANQIYVLNVTSGGEAVRVTNLSTGATSPAWSPDGRMLLFASSVYPGAPDDEANRKIAAERKGRRYRARIYESFPIRYWDKWLEDVQTHILIQPSEAGGRAKDLLAGTRLVAEAGFAAPSTLTGEDPGAVWAPDGKSIVFAATIRKNVAARADVNTHLYRVATEGGDPQPITSGPDSYSKPKFRPDGKGLYCIYTREGGIYNLDRIAKFAWPSPSERTVVTAGLDRSVNTFAFTPDNRTIYLLAEEAGHEKLFSVAAEGGSASQALEMASGVYTNLAIPEKAASPILLANWESATNPAEVVRIDLAERRHRNLSEFNVEAAGQINWLPVRHFWFKAKNGKQIHNMIALPPSFDEGKKYPVLAFLHGGPHSMHRDQFFLRWNYHLLAKTGVVVLMTNYTGSTGFGEKFAQEIQGDPLAGPGQEINEAVDEAIRRFPFLDSSRQAAAGASYGGHLANWLQASTTRYKCLIAHAGLINLESQWGTSDSIYHREVGMGGPVWEQGKVWREQNPIRFAAQFKTPILLTVGENDFRVPLNQTLENWSVLQRLQVPSKLIVFPDANHWILKGEDSRFFYQQVDAWLRKWLSIG